MGYSNVIILFHYQSSAKHSVITSTVSKFFTKSIAMVSEDCINMTYGCIVIVSLLTMIVLLATGTISLGDAAQIGSKFHAGRRRLPESVWGAPLRASKSPTKYDYLNEVVPLAKDNESETTGMIPRLARGAY